MLARCERRSSGGLAESDARPAAHRGRRTESPLKMLARVVGRGILHEEGRGGGGIAQIPWFHGELGCLAAIGRKEGDEHREGGGGGERGG